MNSYNVADSYLADKHNLVEFNLEEALWVIAEQASIKSGKQEKLFVLLLECAYVFALCNDELGRTNVLQRH